MKQKVTKAKSKTKEPSDKKKKKISLLDFVLAVLILVFCASLFKNISYPLIWNDEGETVMMATRVLDFGYPKVHDGKNIVFMMPNNHLDSVKNFRVGYKKKYDAFIGNTWGMYYVGALGVWIANATADIYQKTFWLRFPFALLGLLGILLMAFSCKRFFQNNSSFKTVLILFFLLEIFSIPLIYHLREARYYSLVIFATGLFFYIYINQFYFRKYSNKKYIFLLTLILILTYHINFITYAIFCGFLFFHEVSYFIYNFFYSSSPTKLKDGLTKVLPAALSGIFSLILVYPFISFFDTFSIAKHVSNDYNFGFNVYRINLIQIYEYFKLQDFFYPALILITLMIISLGILYSKKLKQKYPYPIHTELNNPVQLFIYLSLFFLIYSLMISRSPYMFTRHFVVLQPVFTLLLALSIPMIAESIKILFHVKRIFLLKSLLGIFCLLIFTSNASKQIKNIKEHFYQCTHQYKGVLDYCIPYIQENFKNPENLIIATNYEEYCFMYYLKSKVILGFILNNVEEDKLLEPDIISFRKSWGRDAELFNNFLGRKKYHRIAFPVYDYAFNNIPDSFAHLFKTEFALQENEKADLLIKRTE